jgi:L-iditol 2-dehydrogenase
MAVETVNVSTADAVTLCCDLTKFPILQNVAFVLERIGNFKYEKRDIPNLPSKRHVRVRVVATGLCGSDVSFLLATSESNHYRPN